MSTNPSWRPSRSSAGAAAFARVTTQCVGQRLAIVLDGKVYSAPVIREAITGGNAEITGSFSPEEAQRLAGVIESGNLPVSIQIDSEFGTDPTLGSDSVRSGISASLWGMGLVVFFMIVYYRLTGVIAVVALSMNMLLILGTMTISRATFTMPGIAGIILTIGMAVDANVLIYERMRDEVRAGRPLLSAMDAGFSRVSVSLDGANAATHDGFRGLPGSFDRALRAIGDLRGAGPRLCRDADHRFDRQHVHGPVRDPSHF